MGETGIQSSQVSGYNPREDHVRPFDDGLQVATVTAGGAGAGQDPNIANRVTAVWDSETSEPASTETLGKPKKYYSIRKRTIWMTSILIVLVVVGIVVGVGVGVSASRHSTRPASATASTISSNSTTPSATSSSTSVAATSSTPASGGCVNGTTYKSSTGAHFEAICDNNLGVGSGFNTTAQDIMGLSRILTFAGCMDACAVIAKVPVEFSDVTGSCRSIVWYSGDLHNGDCYLKNATALIGSSNATAKMQHAVLKPTTGLQAANMVDDGGNIL